MFVRFGYFCIGFCGGFIVASPVVVFLPVRILNMPIVRAALFATPVAAGILTLALGGIDARNRHAVRPSKGASAGPRQFRPMMMWCDKCRRLTRHSIEVHGLNDRALECTECHQGRIITEADLQRPASGVKQNDTK